MSTPERAVVEAVKVVLGEDERAAVDAVLAGGMVTQGREVAAFEAEFAALVGTRHAVAVNSGTSALHVALLSADIGTGDEVLVPAFTFAATANAVALTGATPVFVDIEPDTFCLSVDHAASLVTARTAAIVPVHLFGHPAAMAGVLDLARREGLFVLEDAAQSHGATVDGAVTGSLGGAAAFSFYATKNMTTGEGGMITTGDAELARRARLLRNQGMETRYANEVVGLNNRMTDIAAAVGRVQLRRLPGFNDRRREIASAYTRSLGGLRTPTEAPGTRHVFHQYTVRLDRRDEALRALGEQAIRTNVFYPTPVSALAPYADLPADVPETAKACNEVLSLPMHPHLRDDEVARVVEAVGALDGGLS